MSSTDTRLRRARIRAWRRGMKEVDLVLGPYADRSEDQFSEQDLNIFEALLEEMDQDIYAWFCDKQPIPQAYFNLILHIREFHKM